MKTNAITINSGSVHNPELEELIRIKDAELKEQSRKNAKHFASQNLPAKEGDNLSSYTGETKAGYEKLASDVLHNLQPEAHFPEAKMDADFFKEKDKNLEGEIKIREDQNRNEEYEIGNHNHGHILQRIFWAGFLTFIISVGDTIFNTKSFQVTGESLLFALLLSISVSIAVLVLSHITPFLYKAAKTKFYRRLVVFSSLGLATATFSVLAIFRSIYLAGHDVHINPSFFVIVNLFFFIVSTLLSFFILPTWDEIKQNAKHLLALKRINKRKKEIEQLKKQREEIKITILERTKERFRIIHYANYANDRIRKMYFEAVEAFKSTNLTYRTDKAMPECFSEEIPEPNIITITY